MSNRMLLEQGPGFAEWLVQDSEDETKFAVHRVRDVEPTLERNKQLYNADNRGYTPSRDMQHVFSITPEMVEIYTQLWGANPLKKGNEKLLERMINDPDLRGFRASPGRFTWR